MSDTTQTRKPGLSRTSLICGGILWTAVFCSIAFLWQNRQPEVDAATQEPARATAKSEASVKISFPARKLPDFTFDECMGGTVSLDDLKGKPWVASFVFTRCASTCPIITAAVMKLHNQVIDKNPDIVMVTITVDPKFDTTEILKTYSETFQPNRDRWKFLTGGQQAIYELVVNGFGMYVKENVGKMRLPGFEVAHTNRVILVNKEGTPVGTFLGTRDEDMVKLRRILTGKDDFPEPGPRLKISSTEAGPMAIKFDAKPVEDSEDESASESNAAEVANDESSEPEAATDADSPAEKKKLTPTEHNALIDAKLPAWAKSLPTINASLNCVAGLLLLAGYVAIKSKHKTLHRNLMISAFIASAAFLACYLTYHYQLGEHTGEHGKQFVGSSGWKTAYFAILIPHVLLAALVPILAIRVFQHAFAERWDAHKRLAKITFPIWMFVSVTGVVIYGMLYHWPTA